MSLECSSKNKLIRVERGKIFFLNKTFPKFQIKFDREIFR